MTNIIDEIENSLINLVPISLAKFPKDRYQPSYIIERLDKKEVRPSSMQVNFPCVKVLVTIPGNPKKQCYMLYSEEDNVLQGGYYNGRSGRYSVLNINSIPSEDINVFKLATDLATFIEKVVIPLRALSIGGV